MDINSVPPATTRSSRPAMIEAAAMLTLVMPSSIGNHLKEIGVIAVTPL